MKDFEKELEEELEKSINKSFPKADKAELSKFDKLLDHNKKTMPKIIWFRSALVACLLTLVVTFSVLIPVWLKDETPDTVRYYGDNDVIKIDVTTDFLQEQINNNIPNYNFIFEDYTVSDELAIYDKETETNLLALSLRADKNNTPIIININIILNKNFTYSNHSRFVQGANIESLNNITIYTKEVEDLSNTYYYVLLERPTYNTYLILNINDTEILNKFKQN